MLTASAPEKTSPFAITGIFTAATASAITPRRTVPLLYISSLVLPCTQTEEAPAASAILAICAALIPSLSNPARIFTVTGTGDTFTAAEIIFSASAGSFISAEPSPPRTTFLTGQPMFISIAQGLTFAASYSAVSA